MAYTVVDEQSLLAALGSAENQIGINLLKPFSLSSPIALQAGKNITIESGQSAPVKISRGEAGGHLFMVPKTTSLALRHIALDGEGPVKDKGIGALILNEGSLKLSGAILHGGVSNYGNGGGVLNYGDAVMEGGEISGCSTAHDGGAIANEGFLRLRGAKISNNTAKYNGGGISNAKGAFLYIEDGEDQDPLKEKAPLNSAIESNSSSCDGGGVHSLGEINIKGARISSNSALGSGGGAYIATESGANIENASITNNSAQNGGGFYHNSGNAALKGTDVRGNKAAYGAGGYIGGGALNALGGSFSSNSSEADGGGIYLGQGSLSLSGAEVSSNTSGQNGAGIYSHMPLSLENGTSIAANRARGNGGGVHSEGDLTINGAAISGNAALRGGGCSVLGGLSLRSGEVSQNSAQAEGGGIYLGPGHESVVDGGKVAGNTAENGGGIALSSGAIKIRGGEISSNQASKNGGGLYAPYETLPGIEIGKGASFDLNKAPIAYLRNPDDDSLYGSNISDNTWSYGLNQGYNNIDIAYQNYKPASSVSFEGAYRVKGRALQNGQANFSLLSEGGALISRASNEGGTVKFPSLDLQTYSPGEHEFYITEDPKSDPGWSESGGKFKAVASVEELPGGAKTAAVSYPGPTPDFIDTYAASGTANINFTIDANSNTTKGARTFGIYDKNGNLLQTGTNTDKTSVSILNVPITMLGNNTYTIKEIFYDTAATPPTVATKDVNINLSESGQTSVSFPNGSNIPFIPYPDVPFELHAKKTTLNALEPMKAGMFTIETRYGSTYTATNDADGNFVFKGLIANTVGNYKPAVYETNLPEGYKTNIENTNAPRFNVNVGELKTATGYTLNVTSDVINITNNYVSPRANVSLNANLTANEPIPNGLFEATVYDGKNPIGTAKVDSNGKIEFPSSLTNLIFTTAGTRIYTIKMTGGAGNGWSFDDASKTVTATVTVINDSVKGIIYTVSYNPANVFSATYVPAPGSVAFKAEKTYNPQGMHGQLAYFTLTDATDPNNLAIISNGQSDNNGNVVFSPVAFTKPGTYTYIIKEGSFVQDGTSGWYQDDPTREDKVTVTVTDVNGTLQSDVVYDRADSFVNDYIPSPALLSVSGSKKFVGGNPRDGMFAFDIKDSAGAIINSATNIGSQFQFSPIAIDKAGTYDFTLSERPTGNGWEASPSSIALRYEVTDDLKGNLLIKQISPTEPLLFTNTYTASPVEYSLPAKKIGKGGILKDNQFKLMASGAGFVFATSNANGDIAIPLKFEKTGKYTYTFQEINIPTGWAQDSGTLKSFDAEIEVIDNGKGALEVKSVALPNGSPVFYNTYTAQPVTSSLKGTKMLMGAKQLSSGQFSFEAADSNGAVLTAVNDANGDITFPGQKYTQTGTYVYTIRETSPDKKDGVTIDTSDFTAKVNVKDDGVGNLYTDISYDPHDPLFVNTYQADPVNISLPLPALKGQNGAKSMPDGVFNFQLYDTNSKSVVATSTADSYGDVKFDFQLDKAGTYHYEVTETGPEKAGWTLDKTTVYPIDIDVADNMLGNLIASVTRDEYISPPIVNTYKAARGFASAKAAKTASGNKYSAGQFQFALVDPSGSVAATATNDKSGNIEFPDIGFDTEGNYNYTIIEVSPDGKGWASDQAVFPALASVTDDGNGQLKASFSYPKGAPSFNNTYTAKEAQVTLSALKQRQGPNAPDTAFSFSAKEPKTNALLTAENRPDNTIEFPPMVFTKTGDYEVTIGEDSKNGNGWTVDANTYMASVQVTDDGEGQLHAVYTYQGGSPPAFTNVYASNPIDLTIPASKNPIGHSIYDGQFQFSILDEDGNQALSASNDAQGNIAFGALSFKATGVYNYTVVEDTPSGNGWEAKGERFPVEITVTDDGVGNLVASAKYPGGAPLFTNTYTALPVKATFEATKKLNGKTLEAGQFSFAAYDENGDQIASASNDKQGLIKLTTNEFSKTGSHDITIKELSTSGNGIKTDESELKASLIITDDAKGHLVASVSYPKGALSFTNVYTAKPAKLDLKIESAKITKGKALTAGMFKFGLYDGATEVATATADEDGNLAFAPALEYSATKEIDYTIKELTPSQDGWESDPNPGYAHVSVKDDGLGQLYTELTYPNEKPAFVNTYTAKPAEITINAVKTTSGAPLGNKKFAFAIVEDPSGQQVSTAINAADGSIAFPKFDISTPGQYKYLIKETTPDGNGWSSAAKEFKAEITATDNGKGQIVTSITYPDGQPEFLNTYSAKAAQGQIAALKTSTGWDFPDEKHFNFGLFDKDNNEIAVSDSTNGHTYFDVAYAATGSYEYTIRETTPKGDGWVTDASSYPVTVDIIDDGFGKLKTNINYPNGEPAFNNEYTAAPVTLTPEASITVDGNSLINGTFDFGIYDASGKLIGEATSDDTGRLVFPPITFDSAGDTLYKIKELKTPWQYWSEDTHVYDVIAHVTDNKKGQLEGSFDYPEGRQFQSVFDAPTPPTTFTVMKQTDPPDMQKAGMYEFIVKDKDGNEVLRATNGSDGVVKFPNLYLSATGTYDYTVSEASPEKDGMVPDGTTYHAVVKIEPELNKKGVIAEIKPDFDTPPLFTNTYVPTPITVQLKAKKKIVGWESLADVAGKFNFFLLNNDLEIIDSTTNEADGTISFDYTFTGKTDAQAIPRFTIVEGATTAKGWTTDKREDNRIDVVVTDNGLGVLTPSYTYPNNQTLEFTNTYKAAPVAITIDGSKEMSGRDLKSNESYNFALVENNVKVAEARSQGNNISFNMKYDTTGVHHYQMIETSASKDGVTIDQTAFDVDVTVTDDGSGDLKAAIDYKNSKPAFVNKYAPAPENLTISLKGAKTAIGATLPDNKFQFGLYELGSPTLLSTAMSDKDGNIIFPPMQIRGNLDATYVVKEISNPSDGWSVSSSTSLINVNAVDDLNGHLIINQKFDINQPKFENTYAAAPANIVVPAEKNANVELPDGKFEFTLTGEGISVTAKNVGKKIEFPLTIDTAKLYKFTIKETSKSEDGWTIDPSIYNVDVNAIDNGLGQIEASIKFANDKPAVFNNRYEASPVSGTVNAFKTAKGWNFPEIPFEFGIYNDAGGKVGAAYSEGGKASFELKFDSVGVYDYTVKETTPDGKGWTVSKETFPVKAIVTDNGKGKLLVDFTYPDGAPTFENVYNADPAESALEVQKIGIRASDGSAMPFKAAQFAFGAYDQQSNLVATATNDENGYVKFPAIVSNTPGNEIYTIKEITGSKDGWVSDSESVYATVDVKDNGIGQLVSNITYGDRRSFTNTYHVSPVSVGLSAGTKVTTGKTLIGNDFSFGVYDSKGSEIKGMETYNDINGKIAFPSITFDSTGSFDYTFKEKTQDGNGWVTDKTAYPAHIDVTDDGKGALVASINYPNGAPAFSNAYSANSVSVSLAGVKKGTPNNTLPLGKFSFGVFDTKDTQVLEATNGEGGKISFPQKAFTAIGVYEYTIRETSGPVDGWSPNGEAYRAKVTVTDNGSGQLDAKVELPDGDPSFLNTYNPAPAQVKLTAFKSLSGSDKFRLKDGQFSFEAKIKDDVIATGQNDEKGFVTFTNAQFDATGVYSVNITESSKDGDGVTTDTNVFPATVTVTDDTKGQLVATVAYDNGDPLFYNTYTAEKASVKIDLSESKDVSGWYEIPENMFEVGIVDPNDGGRVISRAVIGKDGKVSFPAIDFTTEGDRTYDIKELTPSGSGWTIDSFSYPVTISVTDNGKGKLEHTVSYPKGQHQFLNTYKADPVSLSLSAQKTASGAPLPDGKFSFGVLDGSTLILSASNDAYGNVQFPPMEFTSAGVYYYSLAEMTGNGGGWQADTSKPEVVVTVTDIGDGKLRTQVEYPYGNSFANTYSTTNVSEQIVAQKILSGWNFPEKAFQFGLYKENGDLEETGENIGGKVVFPESYTKPGTYKYTIKETSPPGEGWTSDNAEYKAVVTVTDDGQGSLLSSVDYQDGSPVFTNTYKAAPAPYSYNAQKITDGRDLEDGQFMFVRSLKDSEGNIIANDYAYNDAKGNVVFPDYIFDKPQKLSVSIRESETPKPGWELDTTNHTVNLDVIDDGAGHIVVKDDKTKEAVFTNKYTAKPVDASLSASKEATGAGAILAKGMFAFTATDNATGSVINAQNEANGTVGFPAISYLKPGVYNYTIKEATPSGGGWTADKSEFQATVEVKDEGVGQLEAIVSYPNVLPIFTNTYKADPSSAVFSLEKAGNGNNIAAGQFSFSLRDLNGNVISTKTNNAEGKAYFDPVKFDQTGTYIYEVVENPLTEPKNGWTGDIRHFRAVADVTDDGNGSLITTVSYPDGAIKFENQYIAAPVKPVFTATKKLSGMKLEGKRFDFAVFESGALIAEGVNDDSGNINFTTYKEYDNPGNYSAVMRETSVSKNGITTDAEDRPITINISDDGLGHFISNVTYDNGAAVFNNTYNAAPASVAVEAALAKQTQGWNLSEAKKAFEFGIVDASNNIVAKATASGDGTLKFTPINFTESKTADYKIKELTPSGDGWVTATNEANLKIAVIDDGLGQLQYKYEFPDGQPMFMNVYKAAPAYAKFSGKKDEIGEAKYKEFQFGVYDSNGTLLKVAGNKSDGTIEFPDLEISEKGKSTYTVKEISNSAEGWKVDPTSFPAVIYAVDDGTGQIAITLTYPNGVPSFTNVYTAKSTSLAINGGKSVQGWEFPEKKFSFGLFDKSGNLIDTTENINGAFNFKAQTYDKAGLYEYTVKELTKAGEGWKIDDTVYSPSVTVTDDGIGELHASLSIPYVPINFSNAYKASPVTANVIAQKTAEGWPLEEGMFEFKLYDDENNSLVSTATNGPSGVVAFPGITFNSTGTYNYIVAESPASAKGWAQDTKGLTAFPAQAIVTDDSKGNLVATFVYQKGAPAFNNIYTPDKASSSLEAVKSSINGPKRSFEFKARDINTNTEITATSDPQSGAIKFPDVVYSQKGDYEYEIYESSPASDGWAVDTTKYRAIVKVTDDGTGKLASFVSYPDITTGKPIFVNTYTAKPATASLSVAKTANRALSDNMFSFAILDSSGKEIAEGKNKAGTVTFSSVAFTSHKARFF